MSATSATTQRRPSNKQLNRRRIRAEQVARQRARVEVEERQRELDARTPIRPKVELSQIESASSSLIDAETYADEMLEHLRNQQRQKDLESRLSELATKYPLAVAKLQEGSWYYRLIFTPITEIIAKTEGTIDEAITNVERQIKPDGSFEQFLQKLEVKLKRPKPQPKAPTGPGGMVFLSAKSTATKRKKRPKKGAGFEARGGKRASMRNVKGKKQ